ncbi:MAG: UDP-N-acetylmuramoyl-L-alanyl-D-glutamate--2,6-diaminopimelate ligase [Bacteroidales bacterium]|jgi:UDP-N-acetylmuramoyl-L-alanyl-D-glutamate--2,6-diaminopimelate ligase|nr:UDP-N-acetylmuramoyl-L-alanyl-D-glutamate--2,6-diaminopimelate ligase [Bacteroidales bacterium]
MIQTNLKKLLDVVQISEIRGAVDINISAIQQDSRKVQNGDLFVAVKGTLSDGHKFIDMAVDKGAIAVLCSEMPEDIKEDITYILVKDTSVVLPEIASEYYGRPSEKLELIGITGTNGKTTIATLLYRLMRLMGEKAGLLSTVVNYVDDEEFKATHTTPEPIVLNQLLSKMVEAGCRYCFMEVSSHAVHQNRIGGLKFRGGVFTNLSHDHLDYHKTFAEYLKAKKMFFDGLDKDAFALYNADDKNGSVMMQNCNADKKSFAIKTIADYKAKVLETHLDGMELVVNGNDMWVQFIGHFNASNLLAVYGVATLLGMDEREILTKISMLKSVDGRFETIKSDDGVLAIIDYAHTPDALDNVLNTIDQFKNNGQVITVVGAGGNRDKAKRPVMASVALKGSDLVVLTSDNPRFENPGDILNDMVAGVPVEKKRKALVIEDRKQAIRTALIMAKPGDIVLVAGKGHETSQEINGERIHFDDKEVVNEYFKGM